MVAKMNRELYNRNFSSMIDISHNSEKGKNTLAMTDNSIDKNTTKITYIGGSGNIGKVAVNMICSQIPDGKDVELVLMGSGSQDSLTRLEGVVKDVKGAISLLNKKSNIKFTITNDYSKTENSSAVICTAAKWPTPEQKEIFKKRDKSGRAAQSIVNANMISNISKQLNAYCPNALFLIVTNQIDVMCHIARKSAPKMQKILGLSGAVDSSRLRQVINDTTGVKNSNGYMIGSHNDDMTPVIQSIKTKNGKNIFPLLSKESKSEIDDMFEEGFREVEKKKLDTIVSIVRKMGKTISVEQKAGLKNLTTPTSAILLPATAITRLINSYCFGTEKHTESYNTFISDPKIAHHYGVQANTELSIPLTISKGKIKQEANIPLLETEKLAMRRIQSKIKEDIAIVLEQNSRSLN